MGYVFTFFCKSHILATIYTYTPEAYPTQFRATGMGSASVWTRIAGTITPIAGSVMLAKSGYTLPFITFGAAFAIASMLYIHTVMSLFRFIIMVFTC
jgi:putative MFS transporter